MRDVVVVIPAYNEAATLPALVEETRAALALAEIVIVDDASTDATRAVLPGLGVRWLTFPTRVGTGTAVRAGLRYARERGFSIAVRIDGDGQHPPAETPKLLEPIRRGTADAAQGSRYAGNAGYRAGGARRIGQRLLGRALLDVIGRRITDPTSGFWAFGPRATALLAHEHPSGYPEAELLLLLHAHALRVVEVGIQMRPLVAGRTSLRGARLGVALTRALITTALAPLRTSPGVGRS